MRITLPGIVVGVLALGRSRRRGSAAAAAPVTDAVGEPVAPSGPAVLPGPAIDAAPPVSPHLPAGPAVLPGPPIDAAPPVSPPAPGPTPPPDTPAEPGSAVEA